MKILITFLLVVSASICMAQNNGDKWEVLYDSLGNNIYTNKGDYYLITQEVIDDKMKKEIEIWVKKENKRKDIPFKAGIAIEGINGTSYWDLKTREWKMAK